MQLLILADDFTGASDAAAPFGALGRTLVVLSAAGSRALWGAGAVDVLAVDLNLRESTDLEARGRTEAAAHELCAASAETRVFLKIDSTLRGPIAGLVAGALCGSGKRIAVVAPAFPEQGRVLHEGRVVVGGQPGVSLTETLGMAGTALVGARFVSSAADVERAVDHARTRGAQRVVIDADAPEHLRSVAAAWQRHADWLLVGSGGLTRQVAGSAAATGALLAPNARGPILIVAGSPAPMTARQLERLREIGSFTVVRVNLPVPALPRPPHGELLVVCTPPTNQRDAGESSEAVADTVFEWSRNLRPRTVVLAGGATARKVCERLQVTGLRLSGELSPGVPSGYLVGGPWDEVSVVTKAGGFGNPATLLDVVQALGRVSTQP